MRRADEVAEEMVLMTRQSLFHSAVSLKKEYVKILTAYAEERVKDQQEDDAIAYQKDMTIACEEAAQQEHDRIRVQHAKDLLAAHESGVKEGQTEMYWEPRKIVYAEGYAAGVRDGQEKMREDAAKMANMSKNAAGLSQMGAMTACDLIAERIRALPIAEVEKP